MLSERVERSCGKSFRDSSTLDQYSDDRHYGRGNISCEPGSRRMNEPLQPNITDLSLIDRVSPGQTASAKTSSATSGFCESCSKKVFPSLAFVLKTSKRPNGRRPWQRRMRQARGAAFWIQTGSRSPFRAWMGILTISNMGFSKQNRRRSSNRICMNNGSNMVRVGIRNADQAVCVRFWRAGQDGAGKGGGASAFGRKMRK